MLGPADAPRAPRASRRVARARTAHHHADAPQECTDLAERMLELDRYVHDLLSEPALMLSMPVCHFLDAIDAQSFRAQLIAELPTVHRFGVAYPDVPAEPPLEATSATVHQSG